MCSLSQGKAMKRRSRAGPEQAKSRRRKTITQKSRDLGNPSVADRKTQSHAAQLTRERDEALEREKATAEVLRVISSSPGELEPVFQAMLENAVRICAAKFGTLNLCEGDEFRIVAMHGVPPAVAKKLQVGPRRSSPNSALGRAARTKQTVHIADVLTERGFFETPPGFPGPQLSTVAGEHPEAEMGRYLTAAGFAHAPPLLGEVVRVSADGTPLRSRSPRVSCATRATPGHGCLTS
jgi:hypothetical protein